MPASSLLIALGPHRMRSSGPSIPPPSVSKGSPRSSIKPSATAVAWLSGDAAAQVASALHNRYIRCAGLRGASGDTIPGALSILKGAVPGWARGFGHMAPTYFRREPGIDSPTAIAAPHFIAGTVHVNGRACPGHSRL